MAIPRYDRVEPYPSVDIDYLRRIRSVVSGLADDDDARETIAWVESRGVRVTVVFDRDTGVVEISCAGGRASFRVA